MLVDSGKWNGVSTLVAVALATCAGAASCTTYDRTIGSKSSASPPTAVDASAGSTSTDPEPRLVVLIVVDQLPAWSFHDISPHLDGGLARLLREGTALTGRYPYAATLTAPGHATLGTGVTPDVSGIFVNRRYDASSEKVISSVHDDTSDIHVLVGGAPSRRPGGASSWQLRVDGTADALRLGTQGLGKSVSISIKDRAAILPLGRRPDLAVWYDPEQPAMTTSTYYAAQPPAWLTELAQISPLSERVDDVWTPKDVRRLALIASEGDAPAGESPYYGLQPNFPHAIGEANKPELAFGLTPASDAVLIETALAAIDGEGLGTDDVPDVLSISFSAHDKSGHVWGQESWERTEVMLRLDEALGEFFEELDARVGPDGWSVVLTADHGAAPRVERSARHWDAVRVSKKDLARVANEAASGVLGDGRWIAHAEGMMLWLDAAADAVPAATRSEAIEAVAQAVAGIEGIEDAWPAAGLVGHCDDRPELLELVCHSLPQGLAADVYYVPRAHSVIGSTHGTTHGSPHLYDRDVPIVIRSPWAHTPRPNGAVSMLRVAPTLAHLLGVAPPKTAREDPLVEKR